MNSHQYEIWRVLFALITAVLGGLLTGHWLASFLLTAISYMAWFWYRLGQVIGWLKTGAKNEQAPDATGIWGELIYHIQTLKRKSTARKQRLRALVRRLQNIISKLPYATVVLDKENHIQWFNTHAIATLGLNRETDPGQRLDNLVRNPEFQQFLASAQSDRSAAPSNNEIVLKNPFGRHTCLAIQIVPVEDNLRLLIAQDISDEMQLRRMRRNFIANASHELRTPLTVISGYLEMLQETPNLPESVTPILHSLTEQSRRMQALVEDLLTISRLENSAIDPQSLQAVTMATIIRNIIENHKKTDQDAHHFECELDDSLAVLGNPTELESIVTNLITNAIRHTPPQTRIQVSWHKNLSGEACLSVRDNGPGIAQEHLPHLTERFYRVDKGRSKNTGGTGLGLAIVQHVVNRHRGRLEIHSEPGKGCEFLVVLPADLVTTCSD